MSAEKPCKLSINIHKLQVGLWIKMLLLLIALKPSLFYKVSFRLKSLFSFSSWKPQQEKKKSYRREYFKSVLCALNCQPSRNKIIQLVIHPRCKLLKSTLSNIDISIIGRDDTRLCLQTQVILNAWRRRKCLARHQIFLWEGLKRTIAIYSLWLYFGGHYYYQALNCREGKSCQWHFKGKRTMIKNKQQVQSSGCLM